MNIIQFFTTKIQPFFNKISNLLPEEFNTIASFKELLKEKDNFIKKLKKQIQELKGEKMLILLLMTLYHLLMAFLMLISHLLLKLLILLLTTMTLLKINLLRFLKLFFKDYFLNLNNVVLNVIHLKNFILYIQKIKKKVNVVIIILILILLKKFILMITNKNFAILNCKKTLILRTKRSAYDVYVCKNSKCSYYVDKIKDKKYHRDKVHYIYRHINLNIDKVFQIIQETKTKAIFNFKFRKFNMDILSKVLTLRINSKLSTRDTTRWLTTVKMLLI